jgi:hypothetical protein
MVRVAPTSGRNGHEFAEDLATAFKHAGIDTNSTDFPVPAHYGIRIFAQHETTFVADIKSALDATGIPATVETGPTAPGNDIILSIGDAAKPQ